MKTILLKQTFIILFFTFHLSLSAQWFYDEVKINFESPTPNFLKIDSSSIWQVGKPRKFGLSIKDSFNHVIITDSLKAYSINDTSYFLVEDNHFKGFRSILYGVWFDYWCDTDSLNDYGTIEISLDRGTTWINILKDTVIIDSVTDQKWYNQNQVPVLSGNSNGWSKAQIFINELLSLKEVKIGSTIIYRFGFVSDSIPENKAGIMYDNFKFVDYTESVEILKGNKLSFFPNPAVKAITIVSNSTVSNSKTTIKMYDLNGKLLFQDNGLTAKEYQIDVSNLVSGTYLLEVTQGSQKWYEKIVVSH